MAPSGVAKVKMRRGQKRNGEIAAGKRKLLTLAELYRLLSSSIVQTYIQIHINVVDLVA